MIFDPFKVYQTLSDVLEECKIVMGRYDSAPDNILCVGF